MQQATAVSFGRWLKERRKTLDLTQDQLARTVGCALITIKKLEADERRPSRHIAERLLEVMAIPESGQMEFLRLARGMRHGYQVASPSESRPQQLPIPLTPLIGRAHEVAAVCTLLEQRQMRLLTLVGPPGIGKTRLSVHAAADLRDVFADGVYFVPLAPVDDPKLVLSTIAQALDVGERDHQPLVEQLKQHLAGKQTLLVLDNFEQIVAAAPLVGELLAAAPRLQVLATSRAPLHIYGEHEYAVPPLVLPDLLRLPPIADLATVESVRLFVERAQGVRSEFTLTPDNAPAVAAICARLDGLPLAIELAAARIKVFTPQALLARLSPSLDWLAGGAHDLPPRHKTLRTTIAWSYDLLPEHEQVLFRRLGVFVGGWSIEAVEAVCLDDNVQVDGVDALLALLDKSLLRSHEDNDGEPRFTMLELIHEYARERLVASGEAKTVHRRHAEYFLALAETAAPLLRGPEQVAWLNRLEQDHDNFRAALAWSQTGDGDRALGVRLAVALARFWLAHAHLSEGRRWLEQALTMSDGLEPALRAKALFELGALAQKQGDLERHQVLQEASLALYQQLEDPLGIAAVLNVLGNPEPGSARGLELHAESLRLYREQGDLHGIAKVLINLGGDMDALGDREQAQMHWEESLQLSRQLGDVTLIGYALILLGCSASAQNDPVRAAAYLKESLALFYQLKDRHLIANCFTELAHAAAQEQPVRAVRLYGAARTLHQATGVNLSPKDLAEDEHHQAIARAQIGEIAFDTAWAEGRAMTLDQAVAYALEEVDAE